MKSVEEIMALNEPLLSYYLALRRLITNSPLHVAKGIKISNDSVALEAGRGKGSIKKARAIFRQLIIDIATAAESQTSVSAEKKLLARCNKLTALARKYRNERDAALSSLLSRIYEVHELKAAIGSFEVRVKTLSAELNRKNERKISPIK